MLQILQIKFKNNTLLNLMSLHSKITFYIVIILHNIVKINTTFQEIYFYNL